MRRFALAIGIIGAIAFAAGAETRPDEARVFAVPGPTIAAAPSTPPASKEQPSKENGATRESTGVTSDPKPQEPPVAAKTIFGAAATPASLAARSIGFYSRGCLAGAVAIPTDGETWQVMRLSRNRNWGHPKLVAMVKRLAGDVAAKDGWQGLLVGDISQPRGGPMLTGHNSHQIGLDADIWLTPMPNRRLTAAEREALSATSMLGKDGIHADPQVFTPYHAALIRRAASYGEVERVLVHPGIKKAMCEEKGVDRKHFHKIRPYWGHHYHMHIRIACPPDSVGCRPQPPAGPEDGCGKEVDDWIALLQRPPKVAQPGAKPSPPPKPVTLADLPPECRLVVEADGDDGRDHKPGKPQDARGATSR